MASLEFLDPRLRGPEATSSASSKAKRPVPEDDDSEWEYEYSNTEKETFYVTLDLSKADFKAQAQDQAKPNTFPSRGSWQIQKASEMFLNRRKVANDNNKNASHNSGGSSAASSDVEREDEDQDQDETLRDARKRRGGTDANDDEHEDDGANNNNHERVQILELHSENPIISYKGRVFSGQWCENITTELLFTRHHEDEGDDSSLPVLKTLEGGVDLLAASCSRITVTEQRFRPKVSERERQRASAHLPPTVIPPADPKATQERNDQRNFLADLIAVKRRKGETDEVTIIAQSMQGKLAKMKSKGLPVSRRSRYVKTNRLVPVRGSEDKGSSRRGGRRKGSGRTRGKWAFLPLEAAKKAGSASGAASGSPSAEGDDSGSTPTPFRWDDLEGEQGGDSPTAQLDDIVEEDMGDEQDEDEAEDEDNDDDHNDYDAWEDDEMDVDEDED